MTTRTVRARNFRSLDRFAWSPEGVCLLAGANGTGKSTVLEVVLFLRILFERGHEAAFAKVGASYFRSIRSSEDEPVVFEVEVGSLLWRLRFPMATAGPKDTFGEELYRDGELILRAAMFQQTWFLGRESLPLDAVRCCAKVLWDRGTVEWMKPLVEAVTNVHVYEEYWLNQITQAREVTARQFFLHGSGANVWSVLSNWKASATRWEGRFEWVMEGVRRAFPGLLATLEFENGFPMIFPPGAAGVEGGLPPWLAADGLLTGLLHLTAIAGAAKGSLVAFDEPENHLHPYAIRELIASMRERAETHDLTIILTTHSPVVMNEFRDYGERVFVLDRSDPARALPVALTELHSEEWLAQAKLGTLYDRLAFGAPPGTAAGQ